MPMGRTMPRGTGGTAAAPVLVVEDDPKMQELIQAVLENEGLAVETAHDGRAAVASAQLREPGAVVLVGDAGLEGAAIIRLTSHSSLIPQPPDKPVPLGPRAHEP